MDIYGKAELLANHLNVPLEKIVIWSDDSLTLENQFTGDYEVSTYRRKYQEPITKKGKFYIYQN